MFAIFLCCGHFSEKNAEYIRCETGVAIVGHGTGHTKVESIYNKQWNEDTGVAMSVAASNQTQKFLDQPAQSDKQDDQITKDGFTESNIHYKGSEDSGESHSRACQDTEEEGKQYVLT